ncbi:type I glyceraldehyde-3-phosphate dehydrogenase [bacterium]|nr:type I glyceraldehyde-3-phosphate dehydrogenase [bacterium]
MPLKIAINGFGRIGRSAFRVAAQTKGVEVVAINDLIEPKLLAHLLKYDSVYGEFSQSVVAGREAIKVAGKSIPVSSIKEPAKLPWKKYQVDVVLECTGIFRKTADVKQHLIAGAKKVVVSAPGKDDTMKTVVLGTKETSQVIKGKSPDIVSNASCTTNCASPVMQVLESIFGIEKAMLTTVHGYTADQSLVDGPHKDFRRARAAAINIIPTTTGAAISTSKVIKTLDKKFDGISIRVPVPVGSITDITALLKRKRVSEKQINDAFKKAVKNPLFKNILAVTNKPLVSSDIVGTSYSAIVDLDFTRVVGGNLVKVLAWYDNEMAYSHRLVEMAVAVGKS